MIDKDQQQRSAFASLPPCPFVPTRAILRSVNAMTRDNHLFLFTVSAGELARSLPGQFLELWVPGAGECPISVCSDLHDGVIELCVRRTGRVTDALFKLREGDWVGLRGPYGMGFPVDRLEGKNVCLVAGGLGIAPIRSLLQYILNRREKFGKVVLVYGMRHSDDLLFRHEMKQLLRRSDIDVYIGAEEMSGPEVPPVPTQLGRVTDMLRMADIDETFECAICGPPVMYPYVVKELKAKGVIESQLWLSLERHMKCGIGKCGHCFIGGRFTCKEGPVFCLSDLRFVPEVVECVKC
jgi:sulfhydrogenase subunit gamma (sulfur reductase)